MKKDYESPEFFLQKISFEGVLANVNVSLDESYSSQIDDPLDDPFG